MRLLLISYQMDSSVSLVTVRLAGLYVHVCPLKLKEANFVCIFKQFKELQNSVKHLARVISHPSSKVLGKYYFYQPTGLQPLRMATPEPLPQRALRQSRRLQGQKPLPPSSSPGSEYHIFCSWLLHLCVCRLEMTTESKREKPSVFLSGVSVTRLDL